MGEDQPGSPPWMALGGITADIEQELLLPAGFFGALLTEGDWSFIIRIHALLEAAVTHLLVENAQDPRLRKVYEALPLSNLRTGKLAFVRSLDLLNPQMVNFVAKLSELRNRVVHDVRNVTFSFAEYVAGLSEDQQRDFKRAFAFYADPGVNPGWKRIQDEALDNAKFTIWWGGLGVLATIHSRALEARVDALGLQLARRQAAAPAPEIANESEQTAGEEGEPE
jgi:hypothetical protein